MKYIIYPYNLNIRRGGPAGYLANLKIGLDNNEYNQLMFISSKDIIISNNSLKQKIRKKLITIINKSPEFLLEKVYLNKISKNRLNVIKSLCKEIDLENSIVHYHTIFDFYNGSKLVNAKKTILTTHNPQSIVDEYIESIISNTGRNLKLKNLKKIVNEMQEYAYKNADVLIFPSKEALEPYYNTINNFKDLIKGKKIYYNMTGCKKIEYKLDKEQIKDKYKIPKDKFIISFVGRHNTVKGYDVFKDIAVEIGKVTDNIIFLSAGTGDIKGDGIKNLIDIGWTDDPGSLINASDLFILPNRNTYFDLILLEVMSLGKAVLATNTGGNKTVAKLSNGVKLFENENIKEAVNIILKLYNDKDKIINMGKENLFVYENNFTLDKFAERYLEIIDKIET